MSKKESNIQTILFDSNIEKVELTRHQSIEHYSQTYQTKVSALESVIKKLRMDDLQQGHCFMVFDDGLADEEAYYEYPDGTIRIERLDKRNLDIPRVIVHILNKKEAIAVRKRHALLG